MEEYKLRGKGCSEKEIEEVPVEDRTHKPDCLMERARAALKNQ